jgi:hypothetical protein
MFGPAQHPVGPAQRIDVQRRDQLSQVGRLSNDADVLDVLRASAATVAEPSLASRSGGWDASS